MADSDASYVTSQVVQDELGITAAADIALISGWTARASRLIDRLADRRFYTPTTPETRRFDVPSTSVLYLDHDLVSVTALVNGDGTTITSGQYLLLPPNRTPKDAIGLKPSSGVYWSADSDGETAQVVQVTGYWGYSTSAPADIQQICLELVRHWQGQRKRGGGVVAKRDGDLGLSYGATADDIPADLRQRILAYRYQPYVY